jgi:hypothetical protein
MPDILPYPCIDHGKKLDEIQDSVKRIETCLLGDEKFGHPGLVHKVTDHDSRIRRLEKWGVYLIGAAGGVTLVWKIFLGLTR